MHHILLLSRFRFSLGCIEGKILGFLGTFAKLRKAAVSFVISLCSSVPPSLSVCFSVHMEHFGSH
jgi:hypothetical protein